jgi:hypothetical protein
MQKSFKFVYLKGFKILFKNVPISLLQKSKLTFGLTEAPNQLGEGGKQPGREADHSPPSSAEFNTTCSYISSPLYLVGMWTSS